MAQWVSNLLLSYVSRVRFPHRINICTCGLYNYICKRTHESFFLNGATLFFFKHGNVLYITMFNVTVVFRINMLHCAHGWHAATIAYIYCINTIITTAYVWYSVIIKFGILYLTFQNLMVINLKITYHYDDLSVRACMKYVHCFNKLGYGAYILLPTAWIFSLYL